MITCNQDDSLSPGGARGDTSWLLVINLHPIVKSVLVFRQVMVGYGTYAFCIPQCSLSL